MLVLTESPDTVCRELASRARQLRLAVGWTQKVQARRSGVALSTLRLFERTGKISLVRLVMIASTLSALEPFEALFQPVPARSLSEIEAREFKRQRGRRTTKETSLRHPWRLASPPSPRKKASRGSRKYAARPK